MLQFCAQFIPYKKTTTVRVTCRDELPDKAVYDDKAVIVVTDLAFASGNIIPCPLVTQPSLYWFFEVNIFAMTGLVGYGSSEEEDSHDNGYGWQLKSQVR